MTKKLVIVESPAKARTMSRMLKDGYTIKATMGHVRDLPEKKLGVDVENGFSPEYVVPRNKTKVIKEIKAAAKDASIIYLATDPDREGEAISWHLVQAAKLQNIPAKRVVFHEITQDAITEAFKHPKNINMKLVDAQQTRRILDRLVGYKISPILWRKVRKGLSAGRVQSVTVRMIVEREREIEGFVSVEYWTIEAELKKKSDKKFRALLIGSGGSKKISITDQEEAEKISADLKVAKYTVASVQQKSSPRQPVAPFITSTLQQEAWRKLRFSAKRTMAVAQGLYEGVDIGEAEPVGLITYMRTDSTNVAVQALTETRDYVAEKYGPNFVPKSPRIFKKKVKGAQEAHEAIRPTSTRREPAMLKEHLSAEQFRLYDLIWKRMVASQMEASIFDNVTVDIDAAAKSKKYLLRATTSTLAFPGFLILYSEGSDSDENGNGKATLPELAKGDALDLIKLFPEQHFTKPPSRYTEATLIKALEENGIGRPSTYAPTLSTIQDRDYVEKEKGNFKPKEMGFIVTDLLVDHFPQIVDISFTAQMEESLDQIAEGELEWIPTLKAFYDPFAETVEKAIAEMPKMKPADEPTDEVCEKCGSPMVIKQGRYGKFLSCSKYPECKNAKPLPSEIEAKCPRCGSNLVERRTKRKRVFYGCSAYPKCDFASWNKPLPVPCPECGGLLVSKGKDSAKCQKCNWEGSVEELGQGEKEGTV
ncbi:MAG: type I DNA topoisomerase [Dehalococcoidia bacterium]|nr:type I DNA topoisomerase [Dehalococcoidia bacterium]